MFDDSGILALVLAAVAVLLSGPVAFGLVMEQRRRIATLETRLAFLERTSAAAPARSDSVSPPSPLPSAPSPSGSPPPLEPLPPPARMHPPATPVPPIPRTPPAPSRPSLPRPSFEERFGTRWTVWIGGLALAFGAALLVRYSVDQGLFGPGLRIASGFALALALVAGGEVLRRRLRGSAPLPAGWPDIPAMVTAAGIVALFGAVYAAHALYGFIGPQIAFGLLAFTGVSAMVAALLHGPALAGLGLVAALATPLLVGGGGDPWPLALYLPAVAASAYGFAWTKGWRALAVAAAAGAALWSVLLAVAGGDSQAASLVHMVLQVALAAGVFAVLPHRGRPDEAARPDPVAAAALILAAAVAILVLALDPRPGSAAWIAAALAAAAVPLVAGFVSAPAAAGIPVAGALAASIVVLWPEGDGTTVPMVALLPSARDPEALVATAAAASLAATAAGALRLLGGSRLPAITALVHAAGAAATPLAVLALAYLRISQGGTSQAFALAAGLLAAALCGLAKLARDLDARTPSPALTLGVGAFASAAVSALALGLVFALSGGSLVPALSLAALGTAMIARRLDIRALRWCVAGLGLVVAARLAWDPTLVGPGLGKTPIWNGLLLAYGVPALAFAGAARLIRLPDRAPDAPVLLGQALGLLLAALLAFLEIRHALHDGDILAGETGFLEQGLMALCALGFAAVLVRLDGTHGSVVIRAGSLVFGALAFAQSLIGLGLLANPLFTDEPVAGGLLVNDLAIAYLLPALAALGLARIAAATRPRWYVLSAGLLGIGLGTLGLSLLVRHGFQGEGIGLDHATGQGEWYAYSAAWLLVGLALLGYGIWRGSLTARLASAALVLAATVKVFVFDLSGLDGPLRALSFLGLGAVLIGIGLVYQRFVFAAPARPADAAG